MSSNSGVIINRSNETSPFFQALKSRNSKSLPELYSAEVNSESAAQSVVEVESSSNPNFGRTLRIELPRYGLLNRLYLHTTFGPAAGTHSTSHYSQQIPFLGAMCIREARLMYQGATLQKTNGFTIVSDLWKHASEREKKHLQELIGAFDAPTGTVTGANTASKYGAVIPGRYVPGGSGDDNGKNDFYCPLDFYFSAKHSPNRLLDLSVLANPVILEIDMESQSNCFAKTNAAITALPTLDNVSAMCYLTELDVEVEKNYRALSYQAGGSPLTQLAFNTEHVLVESNITLDANDVTVDVKLNQFTGSVYKLVIFATKHDAFATGQPFRFRPSAIKEIQVKATGTNIVNQDNLQSKEALLESYHGGGDFYPIGTKNTSALLSSQFSAQSSASAVVSAAEYAAVGNTILDAARGIEWNHNITCNPHNIYEVNFKKPYDMSKVSASGSVAMGQMSVPSLRVVLSGDTDNGQYGAQTLLLGAAADLHVIAYTTSLVSYNTNSSGSTNIRMIQN